MKRITIIFLFLTGLSCVNVSAQDVANEEFRIFNSKWGFGLNGGYGQRVFRSGRKISAERDRYIKDFKSGISFGGDVTYFPWKKVGFGLKYDRYQSKASQENELQEDVSVQFLGGEIIHRAVMKNPKNSVLTSLLLGYQPYQNKTEVKEDQFTFDGKTMGWGVSVGLEHRISQHFAINVTGSAIMGAVYRLDRTSAFNKETLHLSKDNSVDLSRFSLQLGFKFY
jgi:hypothetical protein